MNDLHRHTVQIFRRGPVVLLTKDAAPVVSECDGESKRRERGGFGTSLYWEEGGLLHSRHFVTHLATPHRKQTLQRCKLFSTQSPSRPKIALISVSIAVRPIVVSRPQVEILETENRQQVT